MASALAALNATETAFLATILFLATAPPPPAGPPSPASDPQPAFLPPPDNYTGAPNDSLTGGTAVPTVVTGGGDDDGDDPLLMPAYDDFNDTLNCTNDYCVPTAEYYDIVLQHVYPLHYEWGLIAMHSLVFIVGLIGNALVCVAVYRNHSMRTVTNYFIVNLALADFMVILFCLPPTVLWDVTETWFMGTVGCKIVLYMQKG
ncbi:Neuropeptide SIFamide receptor [Gryllus bimaculatus]|nr:Neuropeptide SIFamide receptor [Gryllus bimaculatus]